MLLLSEYHISIEDSQSFSVFHESNAKFEKLGFLEIL